MALRGTGLKGGTALPAGRAVGLFLLLLFLFARFRDAFGLPFLNDDYVFLDHVRDKGLTDLWGFRDLAFHWWRPWSREFHYWWLQRAFGPNEWPFHFASLALTAGMLGAYWALARRLAGAAAAAVAVAGAATLPGWGLLLLWSAGAQDLWMLLLSLLALLAWHEDRPGWAAACYALALASKETAAPLPLLFLAHGVWVSRRGLAESVLRLAPTLLVALAWAAAHPLLLGRLWSPTPASLTPSPAAVAPWLALVKSAASVFSLDVWPAPEGGWRSVWWDALRGLFLMLVFLELLARPDLRPSGVLGGGRTARLRGAGALGMVWWCTGTLPLLLPGLGWHAYYAHFAALGAWLAIGRLLSHNTGVAMTLIGALAVIGAGRAATPSEDWGEAAYQRRAGAYVNDIREFLKLTHPRFEPHSRLWFVRLPNNVGFLAGDGPAVRVWYRDRTIRAGYYSAYTARAAGEPDGPDHFFRMDENGVLSEIRRLAAGDTVGTPAAVDEAERLANPRWQTDRVSLAHTLATGQDWRGSAAEFRRLAIAYPESSTYAFSAASMYMQAGDTSTAFAWFREAARRPDAPPELKEAVKGILPPEPVVRKKKPTDARAKADKKPKKKRTATVPKPL
jgi:hypothetical protein